MHFPHSSPPPPLEEDARGVIRIAGTGIPLERVIEEFLAGATPEQIVQDFDTLSIGQVYAVVSLYLNNREDVDAYRAHAEQEAAAVQQQVEQQFDPARPYLDGVERLMVDPGPVSLPIPLEMLVNERGEFLVDEFVISYSSSPYMDLQNRSPSHHARPIETVLAVVSPVFDPSQTQTHDEASISPSTVLTSTQLGLALRGDAHTLDSLPPLPFSSTEGRRLQELFASTTLLSGPDGLARLCTKSLAAADLVRLALDPLYAHLRWRPEVVRPGAGLTRRGL